MKFVKGQKKLEAQSSFFAFERFISFINGNVKIKG